MNAELINQAEKLFSLEFGEPVKFNGLVEIDGKLQAKFKFTNEDTTYLIFNATWEDIEDIVQSFPFP